LGLLGAVVLLRILKAKGRDGSDELSPEERERLAGVLGESKDPQGGRS